MYDLKAVPRRLRARLRRALALAWYRREARSVQRRATLPIALEPRDFELSPHTGLSRDTWRAVARGLLENVLQYSEAMTQPLRLPPSPAAGYPTLSLTGRPRRTREAYVEAYVRTLLLASTLLVDEPELELHGRRVADYYAELLLRGVHDSDPARFGRPPAGRIDQRTVEAGLLVIALRQAPAALWERLDQRERERVLDWLELFRAAPVHDTNWRWFAVLTNTFLKLNGRTVDGAAIEQHLRRLLAMHAGGGWFRDGTSFDFYSAWAHQCFPILWAGWDGDSHPDLRAEFYRHNDQFLQSYPHVFSRRGFVPAWGRSQCYRFAASAPLSAAFLRPDTPALDPGFARRLASGNLLQFIEHPGVLVDGLLTLGFYQEDPSVIDRYSCVGSPYWSALAFLGLTLPASNAYWSAVENEGFWRNPPAMLRLGETGMWVEHDAASGSTRLHAPQPARRWDRRYNQLYYEAGSSADSRSSSER